MSQYYRLLLYLESQKKKNIKQTFLKVWACMTVRKELRGAQPRHPRGASRFGGGRLVGASVVSGKAARCVGPTKLFLVVLDYFYGIIFAEGLHQLSTSVDVILADFSEESGGADPCLMLSYDINSIVFWQSWRKRIVRFDCWQFSKVEICL